MSTDNAQLLWWHLILTTKGSWLPGDPRGFRSRDHRIHSSGDYKNRPPKGKHEKLYQHHVARCPGATIIPRHLRPTMGQRMLRKLYDDHVQCLALAAAAMHAHMLVRLPDDYQHAMTYAGKLKQVSSRAVRDEMPGELWAAGGKPIHIVDRSHHANAFNYICSHVDQGAWVWQFRCPWPWDEDAPAWDAGEEPPLLQDA